MIPRLAFFEVRKQGTASCLRKSSIISLRTREYSRKDVWSRNIVLIVEILRYLLTSMLKLWVQRWKSSNEMFSFFLSIIF